LGVPGAVIEALYVDGDRIDPAKYEVLAQHGLIRWTPPNQPEHATASVRLTEELTLGAETDRWKKLAIILPVVATIVGAALSGAATYFSKTSPEPRTPSVGTAMPSQDAAAVPTSGRQTATDNTHITRSKEIKLGQTVAGIATPEGRWFKFATDDKSPSILHVLVRNVNVSGPLEIKMFDAKEAEIKSQGEVDRNIIFEWVSMGPTWYYLMVRTFAGPTIPPLYEIVVTER
jgi:hypothetical protein